MGREFGGDGWKGVDKGGERAERVGGARLPVKSVKTSLLVRSY